MGNSIVPSEYFIHFSFRYYKIIELTPIRPNIFKLVIAKVFHANRDSLVGRLILPRPKYLDSSIDLTNPLFQIEGHVELIGESCSADVCQAAFLPYKILGVAKNLSRQRGQVTSVPMNFSSKL